MNWFCQHKHLRACVRVRFLRIPALANWSAGVASSRATRCWLTQEGEEVGEEEEEEEWRWQRQRWAQLAI